jgi:hypothetical protein
VQFAVDFGKMLGRTATLALVTHSICHGSGSSQLLAGQGMLLQENLTLAGGFDCLFRQNASRYGHYSRDMGGKGSGRQCGFAQRRTVQDYAHSALRVTALNGLGQQPGYIVN